MAESTHRGMIAREAAEWLLRLREAGGGSLADDAEFSEWLTSSPVCIEEFLAATLAWEALEPAARAGSSADALIAAAREEHSPASVATLLHDVPLRRASTRISLRTALSAAAALALVVAGWMAWQRSQTIPLYTTAAHQRRTVTLADGSLVALAASSALEVRWTVAERRVALDYGRARFEDVEDPRRPFVVVTAHGAVRAVGTVFDVDTNRTDTRVSVIAGLVEVGASGSALPQDGPLILGQGDHAILWGATALPGWTGPVSVMAWTARRLVIRSVPLATVLSHFTGGAAARCVLDSPSLAALRISGIFDPGDAGPLLRYLQLYEGLRTRRSPDGIVHLSASPAPRR